MSKTFFSVAALFVVLPLIAALALLGPGTPGVKLSPDAYRAKIAIEGLFAGRGTAGEQAGLPLVWFRLRNNGRQTVSEVHVHVDFLGRDGAVVHEADFFPVHTGDYGGMRVRPLGPGAVWQMSNIRYYMPKGVPHTWEPGAVTARIESVRFPEG